MEQESERMTELKPCPFCGSKAWLDRSGSPEHGADAIIGCTKCKFYMIPYSYGYEDELVETWNRRANE